MVASSAITCRLATDQNVCCGDQKPKMITRITSIARIQIAVSESSDVQIVGVRTTGSAGSITSAGSSGSAGLRAHSGLPVRSW